MPVTPDATFPQPTVLPPDPAWMQPTIRGPMPVPPQPLPVPSATHLAPQASVWPGVPGIWGQAAEQLLPGGLHPPMAPPAAPAHCWGHPLLAGTLLPQQPMGLWPGAVPHAEPPQPAGTCLPQAPGRPGPPPLLLQVPALQQHVLPVPCTLPASWEPPMEPLQDAVLLMEDQGHPAPTHACPHLDTAPLTCSTATIRPTSGREFRGCTAGGCLWESCRHCPTGDLLAFPARTTSAGTLQDTADFDHLLAWIDHGQFGGSTAGQAWWHPVLPAVAELPALPHWAMDFLPSPEVTSQTAILDDSNDFDQLLTWISQGEFGGSRAAGGLSAPSG